MANGFESGAGGSVIITGEGISTYQAMVCKQGLKALQQGFRLNRAYTPDNLHRLAGQITGNTYPRGAKARARAITDLETWIAARRAAEPEEKTA